MFVVDVDNHHCVVISAWGVSLTFEIIRGCLLVAAPDYVDVIVRRALVCNHSVECVCVVGGGYTHIRPLICVLIGA